MSIILMKKHFENKIIVYKKSKTTIKIFIEVLSNSNKPYYLNINERISEEQIIKYEEKIDNFIDLVKSNYSKEENFKEIEFDNFKSFLETVKYIENYIFDESNLYYFIDFLQRVTNIPTKFFNLINSEAFLDMFYDEREDRVKFCGEDNSKYTSFSNYSFGSLVYRTPLNIEKITFKEFFEFLVIINLFLENKNSSTINDWAKKSLEENIKNLFRKSPILIENVNEHYRISSILAYESLIENDYLNNMSFENLLLISHIQYNISFPVKYKNNLSDYIIENKDFFAPILNFKITVKRDDLDFDSLKILNIFTPHRTSVFYIVISKYILSKISFKLAFEICSYLSKVDTNHLKNKAHIILEYIDYLEENKNSDIFNFPLWEYLIRE